MSKGYFFLTLALLGGAFRRPPLRFFRDSEKTAARSAAKFGTPYLASVPHIVCKNQPQVT